jgi:hypothetical protein
MMPRTKQAKDQRQAGKASLEAVAENYANH